jgi:hypothetical protein
MHTNRRYVSGSSSCRKFGYYGAASKPEFEGETGGIMRKLIAICGLILLSAGMVQAQETGAKPGPDKSKRPSPAAHAEFQFSDGKTVIVDYSSPRAKGRKIFGGIVPYGQVWRAGANEATTFVLNTDLVVGGKMVPAGSYTIFALPDADKWTLIINKKTGEWGVPYTGEATELTRIPMKVSTLPSAVEDFTIAFDKNGSGCTMRLDWETTRASVEITESGK